MNRIVAALAAAMLGALLCAAPAGAAFGLKHFDVTFTDADGSVAAQAGAHPFAITNDLVFNTVNEEGKVSDGDARDMHFDFPEGLILDPAATPHCPTADFLLKNCPSATVVGIIEITIADVHDTDRVYNLEPPPGVVAKLGFIPLGQALVTLTAGLSQDAPYHGVVDLHNIPQVLPFTSARTTLWGNPADPEHDALRGGPVNFAAKPLLTVPRACEGPLLSSYSIASWQEPGNPVTGSASTHDNTGNPLGFQGCGKLGFEPRLSALPTTKSAESPTGMDVAVSVKDEGLTSPAGLAQSEIKTAVLSFPEGVTANPSLAEGLGACSQGQYESEKLGTPAGEGCPNASKIGDVEVTTPLLGGKTLSGSLYIAEPYQNPFGSLLAIYLVIRSAELGVIVKQAGKIAPDPVTGRLVSTFEDIPQLPFSELKVHLREGARSPLISPPSCGIHTTTAAFTPWANPSRVLTTASSFEITSGPGGAACPPGGTPPFEPGFEAGTRSNEAGSYSPFDLRLTRRDGDQDLTRFDATLPPGVVAKLAGVSECPEAAIATAKTKTGREELASPSCPANSKVGTVMAGAGVGSVLTYVPGSVYLAGPFAGAPLSVVGVVPAVAGPFDVGTVVVRQALVIDPRTAEVRVDGARSDPIPHILAGIPLKVRDIQVHVDRPSFTLNPTSCDPFTTGAQVWGGGSNVFSTADDSPVFRTANFQAANCQNLGFKPRLSLSLNGGTKRGGHPSLESVYTPRAGDANLSDLVVRLPHSAFLDQAHIRTICTRVQFAANACPDGAIYGHAEVVTPILDAPLSGPVYLRSSNHNLPDLVADLHGLVDVEVVGRIDSKQGGLRTTFSDLPDAPITKAVVDLPGGRKGLIVNSRDLCAHRSLANIDSSAQNNKAQSFDASVKPSCGKGSKHHRRH